jgi:hypothetical protein
LTEQEFVAAYRDLAQLMVRLEPDAGLAESPRLLYDNLATVEQLVGRMKRFAYKRAEAANLRPPGAPVQPAIARPRRG